MSHILIAFDFSVLLRAKLKTMKKVFMTLCMMLIAFVALIIRNRIYTKLKDAEEEMLEKPNYMNVPAAIRELEKIEMIRQADGIYRLDHAVTATQKTILKAFGIDANYIKRKSKEISDWLNPKVHKVKI